MLCPLTQLTFFKQRRTRGQCRARVTGPRSPALCRHNSSETCFCPFQSRRRARKVASLESRCKALKPTIRRVPRAGQKNSRTSVPIKKSPNRLPVLESCRSASNTPEQWRPKSRARTKSKSRPAERPNSREPQCPDSRFVMYSGK